jgi:hypothetical protein
MDAITRPVACSICLHDIPLSEQHIAEAQDYIAFYFGLECYTLWCQQDEEKPGEALAA